MLYLFCRGDGFSCAICRRFYYNPDDNFSDPDYKKGDNNNQSNDQGIPQKMNKLY